MIKKKMKMRDASDGNADLNAAFRADDRNAAVVSICSGHGDQVHKA